MSDLAIRAEHLSKAYQITRIQNHHRYKTLQEDLLAMPRRIWSGIRGAGGAANETFWALNDLSFEVHKGEVLGIIGRNGAGKSTLLKILSRITEPTRGRAELFGRVGSLLEVGTGFHPELTGRENIYLNGAILGMRRAEIAQRFDEIVEFAEVQQFIETPVKRYSSGMYMRLAFAVAAFLDPEILVVDEVLAVGDSAFQKKCLGKMGEVSKSGRTVLFVSHNMAAVQQLCQKGMILQSGQIVFSGDAASAIDHYLQMTNDVQTSVLTERKDRKGTQDLTFTKAVFCDAEGNELTQVLSGQDVHLKLYYTARKPMRNATVVTAFNVRSSQGHLITNLNTVDVGDSTLDIYEQGFFQCEWKNLNLRSGAYDCALFCSVNGEVVDWLQSAFTIYVEDGDFFKTGKLIDRIQGDILVPHSWASYPELS
jgi:lipopolysaccharide transport system ATP-binding protein